MLRNERTVHYIQTKFVMASNMKHGKGRSMQATEKTVDGFRFLPPSLAAWIDSLIPDQGFKGSIPFTPLSKPLSEATLALVTSAGISLKTDPPFDMEREKKEGTWGDRSFRAIPRGSTAADVNVNHLHINTQFILQDINVILPLARMSRVRARGDCRSTCSHRLLLLRVSVGEH